MSMTSQPRDTIGRFGSKGHSEPETMLPEGRRARLERALELLAEADNVRNTDPHRATELRAEAERLRYRENRAAQPLTNLRASSTNRPVQVFFRRDDEIDDDLELNPPYQRGSVWTTEQRRALVESLLRGLPVGAVILNDRWAGRERSGAPFDVNEAMFAVIDGKQRIETIRAFHAGEFAVPADWFTDESVEAEVEGEVTWNELSELGRRKFGGLTFPVVESSVGSVEEEARIFGLVNSAGTAQTAESLEQAAAVARGDA